MKVHESTRPVAFYEWKCPHCGEAMSSYRRPTDKVDFLCRAGEQEESAREQAEWQAKALANFEHLKGAIIVGLKIDCDYWWDNNPEYADLTALLVEKDGKHWAIAATNEGFVTVKEHEEPAPASQ